MTTNTLSVLSLLLPFAIVGVLRTRRVRLFFLRRLHAKVIRDVEREMQAEYGDAYLPDPSQRERVWQRLLQMEGLAE